MRAVVAIAACILLGGILADAFTTIVLARRTRRIFRLTAGFYRVTWAPYSAIAKRIESGPRREDYLSVYGPLSLLGLIACWAVGLLLAFGALHWAAGLRAGAQPMSFTDCLFESGATLFAVGAQTPLNGVSKFLTVAEASLGISFLGLVVGYLPVLYQSYSNRETQIGLLDVRAGSPPTAAEFSTRQGERPEALERQLRGWESWASELLQHHLSYPMLSYFRSQHVDQSWLAATVTVLDSSAIAIVSGSGSLQRQARVTFAISRHCLTDLARVFRAKRFSDEVERLPPGEFARLKSVLSERRAPFEVDRLQEDALKVRAVRRLAQPVLLGRLAQMVFSPAVR